MMHMHIFFGVQNTSYCVFLTKINEALEGKQKYLDLFVNDIKGKERYINSDLAHVAFTGTLCTCVSGILTHVRLKSSQHT